MYGTNWLHGTETVVMWTLLIFDINQCVVINRLLHVHSIAELERLSHVFTELFTEIYKSLLMVMGVKSED